MTASAPRRIEPRPTTVSPMMRQARPMTTMPVPPLMSALFWAWPTTAPDRAVRELEMHRPTVTVKVGLMEEARTISRLSPVARLGLSIRATGDNRDMVRSSSINPNFTITIGLCVANALTGLSGAVVGQAQKTADINSGTGIVVIGLACLIIGETIVGRGAMFRGAIAVVAGSILYRLVYALVLYTKVVPVDCLKLVTALVVALAIAAPSIRQWWAFQTRKRRALAGRKGEK